ncbi:hypothetical protein OH76DRAFT_978690 [Lentinus brumalis]|uniref:Uncharacterized protein n=1 Tax=Lentinus brumalis TaxID=2498619 RepID=A0A371DQ01_9APHY|nr:hypothetical protein OH76DRAFT_978690 [Polyporus brumalis]
MIVETDSPFLYNAVSAVAHVAGGSRVWPGWRQLAALKSLRRGVSGEVLASSEHQLGSVYGRALSVTCRAYTRELVTGRSIRLTRTSPKTMSSVKTWPYVEDPSFSTAPRKLHLTACGVQATASALDSGSFEQNSLADNTTQVVVIAFSISSPSGAAKHGSHTRQKAHLKSITQLSGELH